MEDNFLYIFPKMYRDKWNSIAGQVSQIEEIRIRLGKPILVYTAEGEWYLSAKGLTRKAENVYVAEEQELNRYLNHFCQDSIYAFQEEIKQGYITIVGGHRVGLAGQVVLDKGRVVGMKNITFLNIRLAHQIRGVADAVMPYLYENKKVLNTLIIAPPGCGKTTLLRILIGLENADAGEILKDNHDISTIHPSKRGMGIVFQNYALFENMTVLQNVEYALLHNKDIKEKYTKQQIREIVLKTIGDVGLADHINKRPTALSGGQQQRVAIARTLAMNPEIILFDEPMSALDVDTRLSLRSELKRIQKKYGTTMIYITHDQEEAFAMSEKIMIMTEGIIHQLDTPENIINNPADDFVKTFVINNLQIKMDSLIKYVKEK